MNCTEIVALIKDLILSGAAITGAIVAVKGLASWQRQLKGQVEYDLSRRLLVSLFKYRDAITGVRHPMMWANEMSTPPENEAQHMSAEKIRHYGVAEGYQARFEKVQKERTNLYADLLEAEALWGIKLKELFNAIFDLEHELFINIRNYISLINPDTTPASRVALEKIRAAKRDVMYDDLSDEGDEYKKDFKAGIENIEKYLKPKLVLI